MDPYAELLAERYRPGRQPPAPRTHDGGPDTDTATARRRRDLLRSLAPARRAADEPEVA